MTTVQGRKFHGQDYTEIVLASWLLANRLIWAGTLEKACHWYITISYWSNEWCPISEVKISTPNPCRSVQNGHYPDEGTLKLGSAQRGELKLGQSIQRVLPYGLHPMGCVSYSRSCPGSILIIHSSFSCPLFPLVMNRIPRYLKGSIPLGPWTWMWRRWFASHFKRISSLNNSEGTSFPPHTANFSNCGCIFTSCPWKP